jgi:hypothetical protein
MRDDIDNFALNIAGVGDLVESSTNKTGIDGSNPEGISDQKVDELDLPMTDEELLKLRDDWETAYGPYEEKIKQVPKRNMRSYLGLNENDGWPDDGPMAANLQFESEETFLPAATAQDPAPFVFSDGSPEGNKLANDTQTMLEFHAQQLLLRRKLALMTRQWSIHHLGVLKPGWNLQINDVAIENRKIQDFVFDPNGSVDVYGDFNSWLGERIYVSAAKLIELFPKHKFYITMLVEGKMGTECCYTEWWNDDYCFTTFKDKVLDKHKNEYFKYPKKVEGDFMDELGEPVMQKPHNHFAIPKKPYIFLSVFSLGDRPHDLTGLIEQNIPNQSRINRREYQLDSALGMAVNSTVLSENNFNQETGRQAVVAMKDQDKGFILAPAGGPINEAIIRLPAPAVQAGFFDDLDNTKNDLRSSWGTQGIASQQQKPNETAKGEMLNQGRDTSRIGGGIVDVLEQSVAKSCYDWLVQLYCVFYDEKHFGAVMGSGKATEYVELQSSDINLPLIVGVTPNSMKPRDELSKMNQANALFEAGAIGPKTYLEAVDYPDPDEAAGDGVLWKMSLETDAGKTYLQMNFPKLWAQVEQIVQQQMAQQQQAVAQQQQQEAQGVAQQQAQAAQGAAQKQQQGAQAAQQGLQQKEAAHQQGMSHAEQEHQLKLKQAEEAAKAKAVAQPSPKPTK